MGIGKSLPVRYGVAVMSSITALLIILVVDSPLAQLSPFFLFYAAVAVSSWLGGTGPGVLATGLGALAAAYLLEPRNSLRIDDRGEVARLLLFVLVGALIAALNGALHKARDRCEVVAAAARRSEARAKRLSESNLLGVFFCDFSGRITGGNEGFLKLVGHTREEMLAGKANWLDLTAPEHRDRDQRALQELETCGICTPFEKDYLLPDGRRLPVYVGCTVVEDSIHDCVGFVLDLSERRRAEAELVTYQQRLQAMASELMLVEERERRRIATVLHDAIGQTLAAAKQKLNSLQQSNACDGPSDRLKEVHDLVESAVSHARFLISEISPPVLYELGLGPALEWLGDRMQEQYGVVCDFSDDGQPKPISDQVRIVLFQATRELLVNVAKHARARTCSVSLSARDGEVRVVVSDDGEGFETTTLEQRGGSAESLGLFNIREKLIHVNGRLDLVSRPGQGVTAELSAPLQT